MLGFDSFTLKGRKVYPRLDYFSDFGSGIAVNEAVAFIKDWPTDLDLFLEVVLVESNDARQADPPASD